MEIQKAPYVLNNGNLPCYVRMKAVFSTSKAEKLCDELVISSKWEYNPEDGYYYYKELLDTKNSGNAYQTDFLFQTIKIKDDCDPNDLIGFDVLLYAEAVQHEDFEVKTGKDYIDAFTAYKKR